MDDYEKNSKPIVSPAPSKAAFKQKDENLAPVVKPVPSKSAFSENVMEKNSVTGGDSARLQKATKVPGRVGNGSAHTKLS